MKFKVGDTVYHSGHGYGKIVALNELEPGPFQASVLVQLGSVDMFYHKESFPYVVQFLPTEKYPSGYKDVYGDQDLFLSKEAYDTYMNTTYKV